MIYADSLGVHDQRSSERVGGLVGIAIPAGPPHFIGIAPDQICRAEPLPVRVFLISQAVETLLVLQVTQAGTRKVI